MSAARGVRPANRTFRIFLTQGFSSELRYRVAIRFAIEGDLRFISHHDTMRLFERALARAQLPVRYSEGFNPRPRMSLPLPRAVGIASLADVLVVDLTSELEPAFVLGQLSAQMPGGIRLIDAWTLQGSQALRPETVVYRVPIGGEQAGRVSAELQKLLSGSEWIVERTGANDKRDGSIDLRPFLVDARLEEGHLLWTVRVTNSGSVRPAELLSAVGLDPREHLHRVVRLQVEWSSSPSEDLNDALTAVPAVEP